MEDIEDILLNRGYILGPYIGKGATCDCYYVQSKIFQDVPFICKVIMSYSPSDKKISEKYFKEEVALLSLLDHPNIVRCYDYFESHEMFFIILEGCEKGTIRSLLCQNPEYVNQRCLTFAHQIISALLYCHQLKVAHLDIKPANLFVTNYDKVKLGDFGTSILLAKDQTTINRKAGSKFFMAPEVLTSSYDPFKADIYSFGVTLFLMIHNMGATSTFDFEKLHHIMIKECSKHGELGRIISNCIQINPADRPTAEDLEKQIGALEAKIIPHARSIILKPMPSSPSRLCALSAQIKLTKRSITKVASTKLIRPIIVPNTNRIGSIGYVI